jgi:GDPmannose 4,6-dehydratase
MKKALICGVTGQDGSYLAHLLLKKGYQVYGTSRDAQVGNFKNLVRLGVAEQVKVISMATHDFRSVLQVLSRVQPDEIYNLSGQSSVGLSFDQPVETLESIAIATLNLLEGMRFMSLGGRLYNAGSSECFGDTGSLAANEDTPFRPRSPYAVAKSTAHWEVANYREAYGLFACTGILFNHESPLRPERFVTQKIVQAACRIASGSQERLQLGNLDVQRDWGWAPEYVMAMWQMLQQDQPEDFVIATGETNSLEDFVATAFSCVGLDWQEHVDIDPNLLRPSDLKISRADSSRAREKLGWIASLRMQDLIIKMVESTQCQIALKDGQNQCTDSPDKILSN